MRHKNNGGSTSPNAPIDFTPLLDVIFIFLFVVFIAMSQMTNKAAEDAAEAAEEHNKAQTEKEAYENTKKMYEEMDTYTRLVSITCTWEQSNAAIRTIKMITPERDDLIWQLNGSADDLIFDNLKKEIEDYVKRTNENGVVSIIIMVNSDRILKRDYDRIIGIVNSICKEEDNVFVRTGSESNS